MAPRRVASPATIVANLTDAASSREDALPGDADSPVTHAAPLAGLLAATDAASSPAGAPLAPSALRHAVLTSAGVDAGHLQQRHVGSRQMRALHRYHALRLLPVMLQLAEDQATDDAIRVRIWETLLKHGGLDRQGTTGGAGRRPDMDDIGDVGTTNAPAPRPVVLLPMPKVIDVEPPQQSETG